MSRENVEIVRDWLAVVDAGPGDMAAAAEEYWDPQCDYYPVRKFPEAQPCHGVEEMLRFGVAYRDAFTTHEMTIRELIAIGDDRVLMCGSMRAQGRGSGVTLDGDTHYCYWLRHGRFFRVEDHLTLKGALHALGFAADSLETAGLA